MGYRKFDRFYLFISMMLIIFTLAGCSGMTRGKLADVTTSPVYTGQEKIVIDHVSVSEEKVDVHGTSTLPDGECVETELLGGNALLAWWPEDECSRVQQGKWTLAIPLQGHVIDPSLDYVIQAHLPGEDQVAATFSFDTQGPSAP